MSQKYRSRPSGDRLSALRVFRSSGIGCAMISLKNSSPSRIVLSPQHGRVGLARAPPIFRAISHE